MSRKELRICIIFQIFYDTHRVYFIHNFSYLFLAAHFEGCFFFSELLQKFTHITRTYETFDFGLGAPTFWKTIDVRREDK